MLRTKAVEKFKQNKSMKMIKNNRLVLNLISLFILYFVQGMPYGLQSRYLPIVMRLNGSTLSQLGLFKLLLVPWLLKFFIAAFVVDVYKSKRFWLMLSLIVLAFGSFLCSTRTADMYSIGIVMFVLNLASAVQDICVDWFAINVLDKDTYGIGNTVQVSGYKAGTLFTGGLIVWLIDYIDLARAFFILGLIYLMSIMLLNLSLFTIESRKVDQILKEVKDGNQINDHEQPMNMSTVQRIHMIFTKVPGTVWMCSFVVIYKLGEQSSLNMLPLYLIDAKVDASKIGLWTGVMGQVFSMAGSIMSGICLRKTYQKISTFEWLDMTIKWRCIPILLITLMIINIEQGTPNDNLNGNPLCLYSIFGLALVQLFLSGFLTTITFTLMMDISFGADSAIQATHYTLLATFEILGKLLVQPFISYFTDMYGYSIGFILFCILYLVCLILLRFYPKNVK